MSFEEIPFSYLLDMDRKTVTSHIEIAPNEDRV